MKKYIISSAVLLLAVTSVAAEERMARRVAVSGETHTSVAVRAMPAQMMMEPTIMTGDATTDAQIKVLQDEMTAKVKAIHEEYQAKIKVLIGDKKVTVRGGMMMATGTRMMQANMRMEGSSTLERGGRNGERRMMATGTMEVRGERRPMNNGGERVEGASSGEASTGGAQSEAPKKGFFSRIFNW